MRALHLGFWLHHPYELHESAKWPEKGYYGGEQAFRAADQAEFQPLLALLERNSQRYPKMHVSLAVSGVWLEQAERWDAELIKRIRKLAEKKAVGLVTVPYYYSMAAFYDLEELKTQVSQMREKLEQVFGVKSQVLALPGLCYHNKLAKWAEDLGFRAVLAGDATGALDWRSVNRLYEAKGCKDLRLFLENPPLTTAVEHATELAAADGAFSTKIFQKQLDLAFLRGDLVNLYFDSEIFAKWREAGIVGFFDELIKKWAETPGLRLTNAADWLENEPTAEISIKKTAAHGGGAAKEYRPPHWWTAMQNQNSHNLYNLRQNIWNTHDRDLYVDFARLTGVDYARGGKNFTDILADLQKRLLKFVRDEEVDVKNGRTKGMATSTTVQIKFDHKARESRRRRESLIQMYREANAEGAAPEDTELDDAEAAIQVLAQRMKQSQEVEQDSYDDAAEAEVVSEDIWLDTEAEEAEMDAGADGDVDADVEELFEATEPTATEKPKTRKKRKKIIIE